MAGLAKRTSIRHLSYPELEQMLRSLGEQLLSSGCKSIYYSSKDDLAITALLSEMTGLLISDSKESLRFGLTSEVDTDICLFKKNYISEHYNRTVKYYVEDLYQEDDESFAKITLPWRK